MLEKDIDPPCYAWKDQDSDFWIDDLYAEWQEEDEKKRLHNYECQVYNESYRRMR